MVMHAMEKTKPEKVEKDSQDGNGKDREGSAEKAVLS